MALQEGQKVRYRPTGQMGYAYLTDFTFLHGGASTMFLSNGEDTANPLYFFCTSPHDGVDSENPPSDCTMQSRSLLDVVEE